MRYHSVPRFGFGLATVTLLTLALPWAESQVESEYSFSLKEARRSNTLICKVAMTPSTLKWRQWEITVGDAWLEKRKDGGCYLCFQIAKGKEAFAAPETPFFVLGDSNQGVGMHFGFKWIQCVQHLDSSDLSKVRLSLVGSWKEERLKNIEFVPTK